MPIPDFMIKQTNAKIVAKQSTKYMRLKQIQLLGGHKEVRASFPIQSQYKVSKIHTPNPTLEKRGRKNRESRRRRTEERGLWAPGKESTEERVGERYLSPLTLELKD